MSDDVWTVGRLLTWTSDWLATRGSETPRLDAEVLLAHVRGCPRIALYTAFETPVDEAQRGRFRGLVKRRGEGEPVAYLVGNREFFSLPLRVSSAVLVPRRGNAPCRQPLRRLEHHSLQGHRPGLGPQAPSQISSRKQIPAGCRPARPGAGN